jgi:hypothetical protein
MKNLFITLAFTNRLHMAAYNQQYFVTEHICVKVLTTLFAVIPTVVQVKRTEVGDY